MSIKTFSVTLTDLGTYTIDVAAFDEQQARDIAKQVLHEHALVEGPGLCITSRETQATAALAEPQPERSYRVRFRQKTRHEMRLPACDHAQALQHAGWLIADAGPLEFDMLSEDVDGIVAEALS